MIRHGMVNSYKLDLANGIHQPGDQYRMALYTADAVLDADTIDYLTAGEVVGEGYKAGGIILTGRQSLLIGATAVVDFADPEWPRASITVRAGLIYNFSKLNRALAVLDLGKNYTATNGTFTVELPPPTPLTALIRVN